MKTLPKAETFTCVYCKKTFRRMSTFTAHTCEQKRRKDQEKEVGVQFGYTAYKRFYDLTQGKQTSPTYDEFMKSPYYLAFVKFGRHIKMIHAIKPSKFIDWVIKNNKKLDRWCDDKTYEEYLVDTIKKENPTDTLQRGFTKMIEWADNFGEEWNNYFTKASPHRICHDITTGDISPWLIYNSGSGIGFLSKLNEEQLMMVYEYVDPEYWEKRFDNYLTDAEYMKQTLKEAGL